MTDETTTSAIPSRMAPLLAQRGATHGDFKENARISQATKELWRASPGWDKLTDIEKESLEQISLKIARILSGKSTREHWEDVGGYSKLAGDACLR